MFNLNNLKLSVRMLIIGLIVVITVSGLLVAGYYGLKHEKYTAKNVKTQHVVETAWGVIDHYAKLSNAGTLSVEEAQATAKNIIRDLRYEQNEYFFINTTSGFSILHPMKPELEGRDLSGMPDSHGKKLFAEMADSCLKSGSGFVDYYWEKPGETEPLPKISFVKLYPAWNWFVGSGIYVVSEMDSVTQTNAANAEESAAASEELNVISGELNETVIKLGKIVSGRIEAGKAQPHALRKTPAPKTVHPGKHAAAPGKTKLINASNF